MVFQNNLCSSGPLDSRWLHARTHIPRRLPFSFATTTRLVGKIIFTIFHKRISSEAHAWRLNQSACALDQFCFPGGRCTANTPSILQGLTPSHAMGNNRISGVNAQSTALDFIVLRGTRLMDTAKNCVNASAVTTVLHIVR